VTLASLLLASSVPTLELVLCLVYTAERLVETVTVPMKPEVCS